MVPWLYLDTARLGQLSPAAQGALRDFAGFAGEVGGAIQFDRFLRHGLGACPSWLRARYPSLADWQGVAALKQSLRTLAHVETGLPVLLAGRSAQLMKFAAQLLCRPCRNILVTDLGWPPYHRILAAECRRTHRRMTVLPLAESLLRGELNEDELVHHVVATYLSQGCDGLLLTAVNNLGVRLPVRRISHTIEALRQVRFIVVDGAQDFRHVGSNLCDDCCDLYLAGCHKWLGAYQPLGLAFYGRHRSQRMIATILNQALQPGELDDPLLRFVEHVCGHSSQGEDETVNLSALFSCQGAVSDALRTERGGDGDLAVRLQNATKVADLAVDTGWSPRRPHATLCSGILLLQANRRSARRRAADEARTAFQEQGIILTAYEGGMVRLSMPASPFQPQELEFLRTALRRVA